MPGTAPTYNNYNAATDAVTTQQFMRGALDDVIKNNVILAKLKAKGRINFGASGKWLERNVRIGKSVSAYRTDLAERNFAQSRKDATYTFPYTFKENTDAIGEQQLMFNSGKEALVELKNVMVKRQAIDIGQDIQSDILTANASSNTVAGIAALGATYPVLWGLPTIFGYGSSASAYNPDTQVVGGAVAAGDKEVAPNTTYGGISTHPTNAIAGIDNKPNEATSPVISNYTSTAWTGTATWAANCQRVLNHHAHRQTRTTNSRDMPDLGVMSRQMFTTFADSTIALNRVLLEGKPKNVDQMPYSGNMIPFGGMELCWDASLTSAILYTLNTNHLELVFFPQKKLLNDGGVLSASETEHEFFGVNTDYSIQQGGYLSVVKFAGQLIADPRYHGMSYAAA